MNQFNRIALLPTLLTMVVGVALLSTPAHAQDANGAGNGAGTTTSVTTSNDGPDYGWLGLVGLLGLAGLMKKPSVVHEVRHDQPTGGTSGLR